MITSKRVQPITDRYEELINLAELFVQEKTKSRWRSSVRFDGNTIQEETNTSCNCHPEYEWKTVATVEEFGKWLDERNKQ
jgi:hypothetical protein